MPLLSSWPLNPGSLRYVLPTFALEALATHPLARELYPQAFGVYEAAAGHAMQREAAEHEDALLLYCVQGRGEVRVAGERHAVGPGALVLLPAGLAHAYAADTAQPWTVYWAHLSGSATAEIFAPLLQGQAWARQQLGVVPQLLADWHALLDGRPRGYELPALLLSANRLRLILLLCAQLAIPASLPRSRLDLAAVQAFMLSRLADPPTLDELADHAGLERFYFAKSFKRLSGHAPLTHFLHLRMARACELLDAGAMSVSAVAQDLGYTDAHYFSRQFHRTIGLTPTAYRQRKHG